MKELRPPQVRALDKLRESYKSGKRRPLLQAPTGFGKTLVAANILKGALARGNRCVFVVDAISLINQTVERFADEGITDIGVIQANHPMTDYSKPVQVASVQTLRRRTLPDASLVIVDEAHERHETIWRWMAECPDVRFLGLSATPWSKGLGKHYDDLVVAETTQGLIDAGYLCPFRTFAAAHPDLTGVKTRMGDYVENQLAEAMADGNLIADIPTTWLKYGENRPTIAFCVNRAHAKAVQGSFEALDIGCGYIDANVDAIERKAIEERLNAGEISVVASVDCLTKGVDWSIGCLILARPTKSEMKYVQMVGRGLRVNPEAGPDCIILDHADNTLRMGFVTDIHHTTLNDGEEGKGETQAREPSMPKECGNCGWIKPKGVHACPACNFAPERSSEVEAVDGDLVQVNGKPATAKKADKATKQEWYSSLLGHARKKGYKDGWAANQYREKFKVWPRGLEDMPTTPKPEILSWIRSRQIAYAKSKKRVAA